MYSNVILLPIAIWKKNLNRYPYCFIVLDCSLKMYSVLTIKELFVICPFYFRNTVLFKCTSIYANMLNDITSSRECGWMIFIFSHLSNLIISQEYKCARKVTRYWLFRENSFVNL